MNPENENENKVQSVETAFSIVKFIQDQNGSRVTDIANELDMSKGSVHRYLSTLRDLGYLVKEDGLYHLGLGFLELGHQTKYRHEISEITETKVEQLAEETGERAQFVMEEGGKGIYIHVVGGENAVLTDTQIGKEINLTTAGCGKAILAHLPEERVNDIIDQHGFVENNQNAITDRNQLFEELETVSEQGYALNRNEHIDGLWGIGAPILDPDGEVVGAISIGGPTNRIKPRIENGEIVEKIVGVANEIELHLAY
jgi:DNA-binding IclR family transcriptional regulator